MKKIQLLAIGTGLFTLSALNNANAENAGTINFTGTIIASACSLNGGTPLEVPLGIHSVAAFTGINSKTVPRDIVLNLTGCPVSTATITFLGDSQAGAPTLLRLTPGGTPATNIAIALFENDGTTVLPINVASPTSHTLTAGANTITYKAAYQQYVTTAPTAGSAPGTATLDIQYN